MHSYAPSNTVCPWRGRGDLVGACQETEATLVPLMEEISMETW